MRWRDFNSDKFTVRKLQVKETPLIHALVDLIPIHPFLHPAHRQQIVERGKQPVANAVIALARQSWIRAHVHFRDRETLDLKQRGHEAMHAFEKFQILNALTLERAKATARVADIIAG